MSRHQATRTWPFLLVLGILFYLCVNAPRGWRQVSRDRPLTVSVAPMPKRTPTIAPVREAATIVRALPVAPEVQKPVVIEPHPLIASQKLEPDANELAMRPSPNLSLPDWQPPVAADSASPSSDSAPTSDSASQPPLPMPQAEEPAIMTPVVKGPAPQAAVRPEPIWSPDALLSRLDRLSKQSLSKPWAHLAIDSLHALTAATNATQARAAIVDLRATAQAADRLSFQAGNTPLATEIRRAQHALTRRLDLWELVPESQMLVTQPVSAPDSARLGLCVAIVVEFLQQGDDYDGWREYLLLDSLQELTKEQPLAGAESQKQRDLVQRALKQLQSSELNPEQQKYLTDASFASMSLELQNWLTGPVDCRPVLIALEKFEQSCLPSDARQIAEYVQGLANSSDESAKQLAEKLDANYRLANMRIAVSVDLLNRLMPEQPSHRGPIRDRVLGVPTHGWSETSTQLAVKLIPDPNRIRFALVADGLVNATTSSTSGPATLVGQSESFYTAEKRIEFGPEGIRVLAAEADAECNPGTPDVRTSFDHIPLLGSIIKNIARNEHNSRGGEIRHEMRRKITARVQSQVDAAIDPRLAKVNRLLKERVLSPLEKLELEPVFASLQTNAERATMRIRLAADEQLAAHTPRPAAPADSLLSMQIHESVLNNLAERLALDGRTFSPVELRDHIAGKLNLPLAPLPEKIPQDVALTLAPQNALQLHCEDGLIGLSLAVADLARGKEHWRDFTVKVFYKPESQGLDAWLARDGVIQLVGPRLNVKAQIALRGIFSKLFPPDRHLPLVPPDMLKHPKLADAHVSQFVVVDGWLGVAVSPSRGNVSRGSASINVVPLPIAAVAE